MNIKKDFLYLHLGKHGILLGLFDRFWFQVGVWDSNPSQFGIKVLWKEEQNEFDLFNIRFDKFQASVSWF